MDYMYDNAECSSACESGWTLYLENSCVSPYDTTFKTNDFIEEKRVLKDGEEEEEDEDLSMVSDASSGPPHFQEDEYYLHLNNVGAYTHNAASGDAALPKKIGKREKKREKSSTRSCRDILEQPSLLDDTASSPLFDFSNKKLAAINNQASAPNMLDFSQGYSTTHFQGRSAYQEHYNFFQSSLSGNQLQQNQWYEEKRW